MTAITATELAERLPIRPGKLDALELERWLLDFGLAELQDGRLSPTPRAIAAAGALA